MKSPWFLYISFFLSLVALLCGIIRAVKGPHSFDRLLSLDYLSFVGVNICVVAIVFFKNEILLDLALTITLICFVSALIFSKIIVNVEQKK